MHGRPNHRNKINFLRRSVEATLCVKYLTEGTESWFRPSRSHIEKKGRICMQRLDNYLP